MSPVKRARRRCALALFATGVTVATSGPAPGQTPLGSELAVSTFRGIEQDPPAVACDQESNCFATWVSVYPAARPLEFTTTTWARSYSAFGVPLAERAVRANDDSFFLIALPVERGFVQVAQKNFPEPEPGSGNRRTPVLQKLDPLLAPQGGLLELPLPSRENGELFSAALTPLGFALVTQSFDLPRESGERCPSCRFGAFVSLVNSNGELLRLKELVNTDTSADDRPSRGSLAVDPSGRMIVAFHRARPEDGFQLDLFARRIEPNGIPTGPEIGVNSTSKGDQQNPAVAAAPDGKFLVAWQSFGQDGDNDGIFARLFAPDGAPLTDELQVNTVTRSAQTFPAVAADSAGNFAIVWQDFDPRVEADTSFDLEVKLRLLRADGSAVAGEHLLNQVHHKEQTWPQVAFAPNGTLFAAWRNSNTDDDLHVANDIRARRFSASPGQEACGVSEEQVACDTGRTGGLPELRLTWGGRPGEVTLFGDWDGDGRDDVCAWYRGRFRCDLDHEGAPAEVNLPFGLPSDTPLLGDVDGDGRADACVRRKRRLLCDTHHDGGRPEYEVVLGTGREIPLLGDLDGDGRDDLCLFDDGLWTCRTAAARLLIGFGAPGDLPALGDLDRDGRDDLCALRAGRLLCDTRHDGAVAEGVLALDLPTDSRPLFGNLDGL